MISTKYPEADQSFHIRMKKWARKGVIKGKEMAFTPIYKIEVLIRVAYVKGKVKVDVEDIERR